MANPYQVQTAVPEIMGGLQTAMQGYQQAQERDMRQAKLQEGAQLLTDGTPQQIAQWSMQNPELMQIFVQAGNFQDHLTKKPRIQVAKDVLSGRANPRTAYESRAAEIEAAGGDSSMLREALSTMDDNQLHEMAEKDLAVMDSKAHDAYRKATRSGAGSLGGATGGRVGTYNPRDYTVGSWSDFVKSGDPGVLERFTPAPQSKLTAHGEKVLTDAQQRFFDSSTQAREYELLANDYQSFADSLPTGVVASLSEFMKRVAGSQDEATELRRRFAKARLSEALKYLPPGPATDKDVAEAFKGVPPDNASPEQVQSFLRGVAKMARVDAEFQEFKANYISENNNTQGMIGAWKKAIKDGRVDSINALNKDEEQVTRETVDTPRGSGTGMSDSDYEAMKRRVFGG